jgi:hypothetical protein
MPIPVFSHIGSRRNLRDIASNGNDIALPNQPPQQPAGDEAPGAAV